MLHKRIAITLVFCIPALSTAGSEFSKNERSKTRRDTAPNRRNRRAKFSMRFHSLSRILFPRTSSPYRRVFSVQASFKPSLVATPSLCRLVTSQQHFHIEYYVNRESTCEVQGACTKSSDYEVMSIAWKEFYRDKTKQRHSRRRWMPALELPVVLEWD